MSLCASVDLYGDDLVAIVSGTNTNSFLGRGIDGVQAASYGISHSSLSGGNGDDTLQIEARAQSVTDLSSEIQTAIAYGVYRANVSGDRGHDTIIISATTTAREVRGSVSSAYGVQDGHVEGGDGNDVQELRS